MKRILLILIVLAFASPALAEDNLYFFQTGGPDWSAFANNIIPATDNTYDLGSSTKEWKDLWVDGTAHADTIDAGSVDITTITDGNIPYMTATGFGDSPLTTDGTDVTAGNDITATQNIAGATYGSDKSISDAELLGLDDGATTELPVGGGTGSAMVWTTATGGGAPVRADTPTLITPEIGAATGISVTLVSNATPGITFNDSDQTDSDNTAIVYVNATATGSGAEVADMYFRAIGAATAGAMGTFLQWDGSKTSLIINGGIKQVSLTPNTTTGSPTTYANDTSVACTNTLMRIAGDGGATVLDTDPAIADGTYDGQTLIIQGTHDTNTVQIADACNTALSGNVAFTLGLGDTLSLVWDAGSSIWWELSRSDN